MSNLICFPVGHKVVEALQTSKDKAVEKVKDVQRSRITAVWYAVRSAQAKTSAFVHNVVCIENAANSHTLRDLVNSVLHVTQPLWKGSRLVAAALRSLKLTMFLSGPFALFGMKTAVADIRDGHRIEGSIDLISNFGWFMDSMATVMAGLTMTDWFPQASKELMGKLVMPFAATALACGAITAYCHYIAARGYDERAKALSMATFEKELEKKPFQLENDKKNEQHLEMFRERLFSKALTYKLKVVATAVAAVGFAVLSLTPAVVVASAILAVGGLIDLTAIVYDKWAEKHFEEEIGVERSGLNNTVLTAGAVGLATIPALMISSLIR